MPVETCYHFLYFFWIFGLICPIYNLDHLFLRSVAREMAGSVDFDGPSVPSENCCSSCSSTTGPISLLFVGISPKWTHLRCLIEISSNVSGVSQNGRRRPQNGQRLWFGLHFGHIHLCWRGDKKGNPLKVNIS